MECFGDCLNIVGVGIIESVRGVRGVVFGVLSENRGKVRK